MHTQLVHSESGTSLLVTGDLDLDVRDTLRGRLDEASPLGGPALSLDLSGVTFVDCTCLGLLERVRRRSHADGHPVQVASASAAFLRTSRLAGYRSLVPEEPTAA